MGRSFLRSFRFNFDLNTSIIQLALISRFHNLIDKREREAVEKTTYHDVSTSYGQCDDEHYVLKRKPMQGMASDT